MKKIAWVVIGLIILAGAFTLSIVIDDEEIVGPKGIGSVSDGQKLYYEPAESLEEIKSELEVCSLKGDSEKDECYLSLAVGRPHKDICPLVSDLDNRDSCYEIVASFTLNEELCSLSSAGKVQQCKENYILAKVYDNKDVTLCEEVLDAVRKETCLNLAISD